MDYTDYTKYFIGDHCLWKGHEAMIIEEKTYLGVLDIFTADVITDFFYLVCIYDISVMDIPFYAKEEDLLDLPPKDLKCSWDDCLWRPNEI